MGTTMDLKSIISEVSDITSHLRLDGKYRDANILDMAIANLNKLQRITGPCETQTHHVIINGAPTEQCIRDYTDVGWQYIGSDLAMNYHPYACDSDHILFFAKPINKEAYDSEMKEFREKHAVMESQGN